MGNTSFVDWPVTYDELAPFYNYVENLMGVQGPDGSFAPGTPPGILRTDGYPQPPGSPMYGPLLVADAARRLNYRPFPFPAGIISQDYNGRPACRDCGFCGNYGCPINAKSAPGVTTLRQALLTNNCLLRSETRAASMRSASKEPAMSSVTRT